MGEWGDKSIRLFGTDGVRGVAGRDLTARLAMDLSVAAVAVLGNGVSHPGRPVAVVGRDPRASGEFLEAAVVAGLASAGVDVLRLGVIPTPGVAFLAGALDAAFGVVISASHNPARDNGIKFFGRGGVKLPDAVEDEIEARLKAPEQGTPEQGTPEQSTPEQGTPHRGIAEPRTPATAAGEFGRVSDAGAEQERYLEHLLSTLPGPSPLAGLRLVADCAHGAAYLMAPEALRRAGAEVIAIGAEPDGLNINAGCGSTSLGALAAAVLEHGADAGIAYDGDADRCLAMDAAGQPLDGDQILTVLATELKEAGRLAGDAVVVTVMSNQGFHVAMREAGIRVIETPVGDKHVSAAMREGGYVLGGEQSGHIIMGEYATTGDGVLTSLQLLAAVNRRGVPLATAAKMMPKYPQVLVNVPGDASQLGPEVAAAAARAQARLGDNGRVLVRPSGTEPTIRLMVQAEEAGLAESVVGQLADEVRLALAGQ
ncbi:MAG TPA: phosphoglucosamine mutase [Streptosporangiaceae bacterium]|jgi:phosphoglucosamine mutase|nr:phosphoglucosamine mutase [Streptosporangiaceae bacterium]